MYLENFAASFGKTMFIKSAYLLSILVKASSIFRWTIQTFFKRYILSPEFILKVAIYITKTLWSRLKTIIANCFFFIKLTYLVIESIFLIV